MNWKNLVLLITTQEVMLYINNVSYYYGIYYGAVIKQLKGYQLFNKYEIWLFILELLIKVSCPEKKVVIFYVNG